MIIKWKWLKPLKYDKCCNNFALIIVISFKTFHWITAYKFLTQHCRREKKNQTWTSNLTPAGSFKSLFNIMVHCDMSYISLSAMCKPEAYSHIGKTGFKPEGEDILILCRSEQIKCTFFLLQMSVANRTCACVLLYWKNAFWSFCLLWVWMFRVCISK